MSDKETPQVDPEKVKNLLDDEGTPLNINEDVVERLASIGSSSSTDEEDTMTAEDVATRQAAEENRSKIFDSEQSQASLASWSMDIGKIQVKVDDHDKALYMKAVMEEENIILPVTLDVGATLEIRPLVNFDLDVVFSALEKDQKEEKIKGPAQYASRLQYYSAALQVIRFNSKRREYVNFKRPWPPMEEAVEVLRTNVEEDISSWSWPKWQACVLALRIFEAKLALCNENLRNGNFWGPVDAD